MKRIVKQKNPSMNESTPRPFWEIPQLWLKLGQMTEIFFDKEISRTSTNNTILGILAFSAISAIISLLPSLLRSFINSYTNSVTTNGISPDKGILISLSLCVSSLIVAPVIFYSLNGIYYVSAHVFGGKGKFNSQSYLSSLYSVPLSIILFLGLYFMAVPKIGNYVIVIVQLGVAIFQTLFTIRSFKVVHRFTTKRAVATVLSPLILLLIPICLIGIWVFASLGVGNVFSIINSNLNIPTP